MQLPPASVLASWPPPNYVDPETRGLGLLIVNIVFASLATVSVALRLYTRLRITASFGMDDVFEVIALVRAFHLDPIYVESICSWLTGRISHPGGSNCDVRNNFHRLGTLWLGPSCLGCPSYMAANEPEAHNGLSTNFYSGIIVHKVVLAVVLSSHSGN